MLWVACTGGLVVVEIPLWGTSKTMRVNWAIHYRQSLSKRSKLGKNHNVNLDERKGSEMRKTIILLVICAYIS